MLKMVLGDDGMPLGGLAFFSASCRTAGEYRIWRRLVQPPWLTPVLARCWAATEPLDIRHSCWVLSNLHGYCPKRWPRFPTTRKFSQSGLSRLPKAYAMQLAVSSIMYSIPMRRAAQASSQL